MVRILVTDGMDMSAIEDLKELGYEVVEQFYEPDVLKEEIKNFDVIVIRSATKIRKPIIDAALETKKLKMIIRAGVGIDNIDVEYARNNDIVVANTPLASSASVAELTIGHMFSLARYIYISNVTIRDSQWNKKKYEGIELAGKTLGLIGFGRIAIEVAKRAHSLGMKVIYNNRSGAKEGYPDYEFASFDKLLASSDFISLHTPATLNNKPLIGTVEFDKMKDGVYIINCARGGIIDETALVDALDSGKVSAAALDVFKEEPTKNERLFKHEKVSLTPHIGGSTKEAQGRIGEEIVQIIKNYYN